MLRRRSDRECVAILRQLRWPGEPLCPHCGSDNLLVENRQVRGYLFRYFCRDCGRRFNDLTGTGFARSQSRLSVCFYVLEARAAGMTYAQIAELLPISLSTTWYLSKRAAGCPICSQIASAAQAHDRACTRADGGHAARGCARGGPGWLDEWAISRIDPQEGG